MFSNDSTILFTLSCPYRVLAFREPPYYRQLLGLTREWGRVAHRLQQAAILNIPWQFIWILSMSKQFFAKRNEHLSAFSKRYNICTCPGPQVAHLPACPPPPAHRPRTARCAAYPPPAPPPTPPRRWPRDRRPFLALSHEP